MTKKSKKLKVMSDADLRKKLFELREEIRSSKFKMEGAKSKDVKSVSNKKKDIARILTQLNENDRKNKITS